MYDSSAQCVTVSLLNKPPTHHFWYRQTLLMFLRIHPHSDFEPSIVNTHRVQPSRHGAIFNIPLISVARLVEHAVLYVPYTVGVGETAQVKMHAERNSRINLTQYTRLCVLVRFKDVLAGLFRVLEGRYGIRGHAGIQKMRMRVPSEHVARIGDISTNQNVREQLVIV